MTKTDTFVPNDPLYGQQWHFALIGGSQGLAGMEALWDKYNGSGVSVGVYDDGIDASHEDLAANYDASLHFTVNGTTYGGANLLPGVHGTAVAGIIAAVGNNNTGATGVAWGATVTGVNLLAGGIGGFQNELAAMQWAENFDVMNNSWGYNSKFTSTGQLYGSGLEAQDAATFAHVAAFGRDGLGTIVVKSAGNEFSSADGEAPNLARWSITVAATDINGDKQGYSNFGHSLLIAAPAASVTTDVTGSGGYTSGNYTTNFGGTSASGPVVAGVVALMLEANPNLGWADVQEIIALSASHTGSDFGAAPSGFEPAAWFSNGATTWNGGGLSFSTSYGYGMINAPAAVYLAESWSVIFDVPRNTGNELSVTESTGAINEFIGFDAPLEIAFEIEGNLVISAIEFTIDLSHQFPSALVMSLVSEDGTEFTIYDGDIDAFINPTNFQWTFVIQAAKGMESAGTWTLVIENFEPQSQETGTLNAAEITFYGYSTDLPSVYTFTDDFLHYAGVEDARTQIHGQDPGTDWLNFAAVTGNVMLDVGAGKLEVDGAHWADLMTPFSNFYLGYGDDVLTATDADDVIHAAGGNNLITAGAGDDEVHVGNGNDTVWGGPGDDLIFAAGGDNLIAGGAGNDTIHGGTGNDSLWGGPGDDLIFAGSGDNLIGGGSGNDTIFGGAGNDTIWGGTGNDELHAGAGDNLIGAGEGHDTVFGGTGNDTIWGGAGNDLINASAGGNNEIWGGPGHDTIIGGAGNDTIGGGAGNDFIDASAGGDNIIWGGNGNDTIIGGAGNDTLWGGQGDDVLTGGGGADTFVFFGNNGNNIITDFNGSEGDILELSQWLWSAGHGTLTAQQVVDTFAFINSDGDVEFAFGPANTSIILQDVTSFDDLADHIQII